MSDSFDPYYTWLGIPPQQQPPNHYRLLGVELFETSLDVIEHAADRCMADLRTYQAGKHSAESQKLLNEVASAKVCLLNPQKKAAYDAALREKQAALENEAAGPGDFAISLDVTPPPFPASGPHKAKAKSPIAIIGGIAAAAVVLVLIAARVFRSGGRDVPLAREATAGRGPSTPARAVAAGDTAAGSRDSAPPPAVAPFSAEQARSHQERWAEYLKVPVEQTNSIDMRLVLIPPGEFDMGFAQEEAAKLVEEGKRLNRPPWYELSVRCAEPKHRVRITQPFYLGAYEVTQAEFQRVVGENPSESKGNSSQPVERTSWSGAVEFCRRLSELPSEKATGVAYRLPTEAEWEYACRAGTQTHHSFGDDGAMLGHYAWYAKSLPEWHAQPVGRLQANGWGLYDMHGNVAEWCADWLASDYYAKSPPDDPTGADSGEARVVRGGSYCDDHADWYWCAFRAGLKPTERRALEGFRVVGTFASQTPPSQ
jgi:formylglycine-generating enzyme required for sulfatase activity